MRGKIGKPNKVVELIAARGREVPLPWGLLGTTQDSAQCCLPRE